MPKSNGNQGRPSKLTPAVQAELCRWIRAGNYIETACHLMGISKRTVFAWMTEGKRKRSGKYVEFLRAVREAQAHAETVLLASVSAAGKKDWRAAAWRLERMKPKRYGPARLIVRESDIDPGARDLDISFNLTDASQDGDG